MSGQIGRRVLVIDDDASIGEAVCETLALKNFSGCYVENIAQAREQLVRDGNLGVVIVDYHMPEMTGIELITKLKKEFSQRLAFIVLTGDQTQVSAMEAVKAQAFDFLQKPFTNAVITDAVRRASEHLHRLQETDLHNERLKVEAEMLRERVADISRVLRDRENLLQDLVLSDRSVFDLIVRSGRADEDEEKGTRGATDFPPIECMPVDTSALLYRMLPAIETMSAKKRVPFKARVPNNLPFLYGDEKRLTRAIADLAATLVSELTKDDRLTIIAMKDTGELIINFRVKSQRSLLDKYAHLFTVDLTHFIDTFDGADMSEMKLLGTRVVVHLHAGRVTIAEETQSEWVVRLFLPLPSSDTKH